MKAGGKDKRQKSKRKARPGTLAGYVILVLLVALVTYVMLPTQSPTDLPDRAAIVDQLFIHSPNQAFIEVTGELMQQAGFAVDLFTQDSVTVGLYGALPSQGYKLIVFRVDAGVDQEVTGHPVGLYTTETYSELVYSQEQLAELVAMGRGSGSNDTAVFAVMPQYIEERSVASYHGTLIILMGPYGLFSRDLPQAFIDRGASVVIGWNRPVEVDRADNATLILLRHLLEERLSVSDSVTATMREIGPDTEFQSVLGYYPRNKGDMTLSQLLSRIVINGLTPRLAAWEAAQTCLLAEFREGLAL